MGASIRCLVPRLLVLLDGRLLHGLTVCGLVDVFRSVLVPDRVVGIPKLMVDCVARVNFLFIILEVRPLFSLEGVSLVSKSEMARFCKKKNHSYYPFSRIKC